MPGADAAFAAFVATHEERLVRSLVSETGLPRATAAAVAADVLPAAFGRDFATNGAAYGWLRVAARHRAAGSATWAEAADAALVQALPAAAALAALPDEDRELLRLRYAEGLPAEVVAARVGAPVHDVVARLDAAVAAAGRALTRPRTLPVSLPRLAAAAAAVVAAFLVASPDAGTGFRLPLASGAAPAWRVAAPGALPPEAASAGAVPAPALVTGAVPGRAAGDDTISPTDVAGPRPVKRCPACGSGKGEQSPDGIHIHVPAEAGGEDLHLFSQPEELDAFVEVEICDAFPSVDTTVSCVPRET